MNIPIQIRRNTGMSATLKISEDNKKAIDELLTLFTPIVAPTVSSKIQKMQQQSEQIIKDVEKQVWQYASEHKLKDPSGNAITQETHQLCYDTEPREINGQTVIVATQFYIQPKISELL